MSQLPSITEPSWTDPYGTIASEVYETAQKLWPQLERWAVQTCGDPHLGQQLLMQACAVVTTIQDREPDRIANLPAYLEVTWKRLVLAEVAKEKAHQHQTEAVPLPVSVTETRQQLEQRILLQEIVAQMDDWTRTVFEYQVLGHTFEEMSPALGSSGHVIRTKFHKKLKKLTRQFNAKNAR